MSDKRERVLRNAGRIGLLTFAIICACVGCKKKSALVTNSEHSVILVYLDDSGSITTGGKEALRTEFSTLAQHLIQGLSPKDPEDVAVIISTFSRDVTPGSGLKFSGKKELLAKVLDYEDHKDPKDPQNGTSLVAVLKDAQDQLNQFKDATFESVVVLTDGGCEDYPGGNLPAVKTEGAKLASRKNLRFAICGVTSEDGGKWRRFFDDAFKASRATSKVGKDRSESDETINWMDDQFNNTQK
jgi:hypothetical protein